MGHLERPRVTQSQPRCALRARPGSCAQDTGGGTGKICCGAREPEEDGFNRGSNRLGPCLFGEGVGGWGEFEHWNMALWRLT